jgi:hypothetical protein
MISCTEPYALQNNTFEEALVIEATITNELKNQEIKISKTYRFEENGPTFDTGATVSVTDDLGNEYPFQEINGSYFSINAFQAVNNTNYEMHITTSDGKTYSSSKQKLTKINPIESVVPTVITNAEGQRGIQITVSSFDPSSSSKYYRFDYEETSKATAPKWKEFTAILNPDSDHFVGHPFIELILRDYEARICYLTEKSKTLLLTSTNLQTEDRVRDFPIRFIKDNDYTIGERYSINVKQYIQNIESYTYYKTLNKLSGSGSILSQNQPGFLYGNIKSNTNSNEKVIGFFDVASVSSKRIFFNYEDVFPGEQRPPYFEDCTEVNFEYCFVPPPSECKGYRLNGFVSNNQYLYFAHTQLEPVTPFNLIYTYVLPACGDCTTFSSNIRPDFWVD